MVVVVSLLRGKGFLVPLRLPGTLVLVLIFRVGILEWSLSTISHSAVQDVGL